MVVGLLTAGAPGSWAQQPDPLVIGANNTPAALEGGYQTGGGLFQWLAIAAPQECIDGSANCPDTAAHLWFYAAACTRVDDKAVPLSKNKLTVISLHDPLVTANRVGNVLVGGTLPNSQFQQVRLTSNAIIGQTWFVDAVRGIGRIEDMARLSGNSGMGWSPYRPAHVLLLAPPDDGVILTGTLIFRCPTGTAVLAKVSTVGGGSVVGTVGTLGGDMLDLASQDEGAAPGTAVNAVLTEADDDTLCGSCSTNGLFAKAISAIVYDTEENLIKSVDNISCRCLGASIAGGAFQSEIRLKDLALAAGSQATYWEIFSFGATTNVAQGGTDTQELWTAALNVVGSFPGLKVNFYTRLHSTNDRSNIEFE